MLRRKAFYRIIALLALIIILSVVTIVFEKNHTYFLQESLKEGIDKPSELIKSSVDLRYGRHKEYMRVVFDGPQEIISEGKVRHKDNEVSVTFTESKFVLKEEKFPIPFRRESNKVIFQKNNLEKIRVINLSNPSRLVIDFYTAKTDSDQREFSHIEKNEEGVNTRIAEFVEQILQVLDNKEQKVEGQKLEISEEASDIEKNEDAVSKEASIRMAEVVEKVLAVLDSKERQAISKDPEISEIAATELKVKEHDERIALLLFDNFSGNHEALDVIMPLILKQLKGRDYDVIDYEEIEEYLCERRIRQSSSISRDVAMELGKHKKVNTVIAGSVLTFSTEGNPKIGILARRLDLKTGHVIWSDFVSLTGEDYTRILGLGTIKSIDTLIPNALKNLFATLGNDLHEKEYKSKYKIAILPFKNESKHKNAGTIITHLFQNELANNPMFDPVDYGDVKKTIVNLRVGRKGEVDYNNLQALTKLLGVDVVLTGTVEKYQSGQEYSSPPRITISARLLDSRRNRILWYDSLQLDGEENIIALDWGRLRSADKVAYGAVSDLVKNIKKEGLPRLERLSAADKVAYGAISGLAKNIKTEGLLW